jgi:glycosyltransferase involved in cell wall biosynthesis
LEESWISGAFGVRLVLIGPVYPYRGGIAHYTTMLFHALEERAHTVLLVSFKRQYPQWLFPGRSDRDPSNKPLKVDPTHYWIDSLNPWSWITAFRHIRAYRPDALIMQWWTTFWAPAWFVLGTLNYLFLGKPVVYICHNVLPHEARVWDPWLARLVLSRAKRHIVQSEREKERLLRLLPQAHVDVIPHPLYEMFASQCLSKEDARLQLDLPQDAQIVLFFGIVRGYKGLDDLLQALPTIRDSLGKVLVLIVGEFWDNRQPYLDTIERLGIGDSVIIVDRYVRNEEVAIYFSATDVVVAPYRRATGSGAVQLARGFRVPVIVSEVCDRDATLIRGQGDRVIPPADPEALARAVLEFFQTGSLVRAEDPDELTGDRPSWQSLASSIERACRTEPSLNHSNGS